MADQTVLFEAAVHPPAQQNDYVGHYFTENDVKQMQMDLTEEKGIPILWNHDKNKKLGRVKAGNVDDEGRLCVVGEIDRNSVSSIGIVADMRDGKLKTSLGMHFEKREPIEGSEYLWLPYISKKTISEVSLTPEPDLPETQIEAENVQVDSKERLNRLQQRQKEWDETKNNNYIGIDKPHSPPTDSNINNEIPMQTEIQATGTGVGNNEKLVSQIKSDEAGQKIEGIKAVTGATHPSNENVSTIGDAEMQKLAEFKDFIARPNNLAAMLQLYSEQQKQSDERAVTLQKENDDKSEVMKKNEKLFLDYLDLIHLGTGTTAHKDVVDQIKLGFLAPEQAVIYDTIASAWTHNQKLEQRHSEREKAFQKEREDMKKEMEKQKLDRSAREEMEQKKRVEEVAEVKYSEMAAAATNKRTFEDFNQKTDFLRKMAKNSPDTNIPPTFRTESNQPKSLSMPFNLSSIKGNPSNHKNDFTKVEEQQFHILFPNGENPALEVVHENISSDLTKGK